jgi:tetratricopeptide (TPR) repeat protein
MVALAGGSVFLLASDRQPGQQATGTVPDTPEAKLALAHQYESQGQAVEALKLYDSILKQDPNNVEALTYRGWLLKLAGLADPAQATLDKAVSLDPTYGDAHFFRGMLLYQDRKDPAAAIPEFEAYLASNPPPETVDAVQGVLARAKADAAGATTTSTSAPSPG